MNNTAIINVSLNELIKEAKAYAPGYTVLEAVGQYREYLLILYKKERDKNGKNMNLIAQKLRVAEKLHIRLFNISAISGRN